ncbi:hypothetical protein EVAR_66295_1 [Eumeta japonica]|uniref:Uncharacterized protein n=1 Tax=Eumeta variegata TaxID=151549 RepID=A0A4C1YTR1_EUMVA|nr:hypothetical protein EVAR_66295_1 [Eumeta japonica]
MRSLRSMCGVSQKDKCRDSDVRERCGVKEDVVTGVESDPSNKMWQAQLTVRWEYLGISLRDRIQNGDIHRITGDTGGQDKVEVCNSRHF